jgi:hypothetical protein
MRLQKRLDELNKVLNDMTQYPHHPQSKRLWDEYAQHGVLPFAGGYLDQPQWWLDDVDYLELMYERETIPYRIQQAKDNVRDALKRGLR